MTKENLLQKIYRLKEERGALILAHNYQIDEVQEIADYVGDSFGLSQKAAAAQEEVIVFCGVHFMAESAAILAPQKTVLLPDKMAGCPMADMVTPETLRELKEKYPEAAVVTYVNSSAAVKAESDVCVTSSNALKVVESLDCEQVLFVPDQNLGQWIKEKTSKEVILWPGYCLTHHQVTVEDVQQVRAQHPKALLMVHPECRPEITGLADAVLSTGGMLVLAQETLADTIIVGTEMGLVYRLQKENPDKRFYLLSQGLICPNMKYTTLEKIVQSLETMTSQITVPETIRRKAAVALRRMLEISI